MSYKLCLKLSFLILFFLQLQIFAQQDANYFYNQGLEQLKKHQYELSVNSFTEAINLNSGFLNAYLERSKARQNNQRDMKGSLEDIETILKLEPNHGEAYFLRFRVKNYFFLQLLKEKGSMKSEDAVPYHKEMLDDLNLAIKVGFKNEGIYLTRADVLCRALKRCEEAILDFTSAFELSPQNLQILNNRSLAKKEIGDLDGSIADLKLMIKKFEEQKDDKNLSYANGKAAIAMALSNLASVYSYKEDKENWLWALNKSIDLFPTSTAFSNRSLYFLVFGSLEESLDDINKAIETAQGSKKHFLVRRGIIFYLMENYIEAEKDFDTAINGLKEEKSFAPISRSNVEFSLKIAKKQREQKRLRVDLN